MIDIAVANVASNVGMVYLRYGTATTLTDSIIGFESNFVTNVTGNGMAAYNFLGRGVVANNVGSIFYADWRGTAGTTDGIIHASVDGTTTLTGSLTGLVLNLTTNVTAGANAVIGINIQTPVTTRANTAREAALVITSAATAARVVDIDITNTTGTPFIMRYGAATTPAPVVMATIDLSTNVNTNANANVGIDILIVAADEDTTAPLRMNTMRMFVGTGAPNNANGTDGDEYHRIDGGVATSIYKRIAGVWTAIA